MRFLPFVAAAVFVASPAVAQTDERRPAALAEPQRGRLREVRIVTGDVFDEATREERPIAALVDALHWTTRDEVVARELWFARGDRVDAAMAAELERNLRALGLFAEVRVRLVPTDTTDEVDLEVVTRDRLSITFGGGASFVGGVTGLRFALGESNLFGLGDRLVGSFAENSDGDYRGSLVYSDLHVFDTWHTGSVRLSRTDDGESLGLELRRPLKHLADPRSYGFAYAHDELANEFVRDGDVLAEVPERRDVFTADLLWANGPREHRDKLGFVLRVVERDYEPARGPLAAEIRVPGDTSSVFFGPSLSTRWITGFAKVDNVDTLGFVQDVVLGVSLSATAGARWRDAAGEGGAVQPEIAAETGWAAEPLPGLLTNLGLAGGLRWDGDTAGAWNVGANARAFARLSSHHTFGAFVDFDALEELQDLPIELTLGEDNGLRGYRARQFAGTRRLRTIVEHRWATGLEVATLRLGLVGFVDTGWTGDGSELGRPFQSIGAGLRIGSQPLLGDGVFRLDVAKPLDQIPGEDDGWQLSATIGQVFTFGGNTTVAGSR
ncbi:MAG: hypothetical protein JNL12_13375 [Planctomycetes bacterium]|nr:hypothetical protein [Planctomycetota bacterium]